MPRSVSTAARGYGYAHQKLRRKWKPKVDAGHAYCHATRCLQPNRWIRPGTPWDLGHTPDRTAWTGPEHMGCNRTEGAARSPYAWRYKRKPRPTRSPHHPLPKW